MGPRDLSELESVPYGESVVIFLDHLRRFIGLLCLGIGGHFDDCGLLSVVEREERHLAHSGGSNDEFGVLREWGRRVVVQLVHGGGHQRNAGKVHRAISGYFQEVFPGQKADRFSGRVFLLLGASSLNAELNESV